MNYLIIKSLHIIFVVTWFAALFYMPRLFIYFAEAEEKNELEKKILQAQFKIMQRRLWLGIANPSALIVLFLGSALLFHFFPLSNHPWLILKLFFVVGLYAYHFFLNKIFKEQQKDIVTYSQGALRVINEIATVFLFAIVFLVVLKNVLNMLYGLLALITLVLILMSAIKIYKKIREKDSSPDWKKKLSPDEFRVLRMCGTEEAFTGKYNAFYEPGTYHCAACGIGLFHSTTKYDSGSGWPSFYDVLKASSLKLNEDKSFGMIRTEARCNHCDSHLGHVFNDSSSPTGFRYCINSIALKHLK